MRKTLLKERIKRTLIIYTEKASEPNKIKRNRWIKTKFMGFVFEYKKKEHVIHKRKQKEGNQDGLY